MMRSRLSRLAAGLLAGLLLVQTPARAEPVVTLRAADGTVRATGELIGYDRIAYRLRTAEGTQSVPVAGVTCEGAGCPDLAALERRFGVAGSNVIGEGLFPALAEGYADSVGAKLVREVGTAPNEQVLRFIDSEYRELAAIELRAHDTASGFAALAGGAAVIGLASRRMTGPEGGLPDLRDTPNEHILALDGLAVIVHPDNPLGALTLDQIAGLFAGRIASWAQLGGAEVPVSVYLPGSGSGTVETFEALVMRPRGLAVAASAERVTDHADLADLVAIDPGGIGITSFAFARAAKILGIRQQCGLVTQPTSFAIKAEEYPLGRRLYAYTVGGGLPRHAQALLDFALSDAAQPIIAEAGFVDRSLESQGIDAQGARLVHSLTSPEEFSLELFREMLGELKYARRLSVTFRFTAGSTELETRSRAEAERLARRLAAGDFAGQELLLVGFADSIGEFEVNRGLAMRRAEAVLATLTAAVPEGALGKARIRVLSYGELTPVGCNETPEGRELNRRVEVWLRQAG